MVQIPTHKNMVRNDNNDEIYTEQKMKNGTQFVREITRVNSSSQPILVGTTNIATSELISKKLKKN